MRDKIKNLIQIVIEENANTIKDGGEIIQYEINDPEYTINVLTFLVEALLEGNPNKTLRITSDKTKDSVTLCLPEDAKKIIKYYEKKCPPAEDMSADLSWTKEEKENFDKLMNQKPLTPQEAFKRGPIEFKGMLATLNDGSQEYQKADPDFAKEMGELLKDWYKQPLQVFEYDDKKKKTAQFLCNKLEAIVKNIKELQSEIKSLNDE